MSVKEFFQLFLKNNYLLWGLILINVLGTVFGIYYYWNQLTSTSWYLLAFVPDSPTAVFVFSLSLLVIYFKKESKFLNNLAFFGLIKVGFWTLFVMLLYNNFFFSEKYLVYYTILFILHFGMILEAFVLKDRLGFDYKNWILIPIFYLVGDIFDYFLFTVPTPLPLEPFSKMSILLIESIAVTLIITGYFTKKSITV